MTISGKDQAAKEFNGQFLGKAVYLGELRTDAQGRPGAGGARQERIRPARSAAP